MFSNKNISWALSLVIALIATLAVVAYNQDDGQPSTEANANVEKALDVFFNEIYKQSAPAIVSIKSLSTVQRDKSTDATGFVINALGYVLTAYENVKDSKTVIAKYADGSVEMSVVKTNEIQGWAILKPDKELKNRVFVQFAQNHEVKLADTCVNLSNALNSITLTGKATMKTGEITSILSKTDTHPKLFETSFDLGNSGIGSPLLNVDGHVIGMCIGYKKTGRWLTTAIPVSTFIDEINSVK